MKYDGYILVMRKLIIPKSMKKAPEAKSTQMDGSDLRISPPARALIPSTKRKANMAPVKTNLPDALEESIIVASWVLSPSSATKTRVKEVNSGRR